MLGAIPLAAGGGVGSELRKALGIAIVGGLLFSQALTLFTTPVFYLALDRFTSGERRLPRASEPSRRGVLAHRDATVAEQDPQVVDRTRDPLCPSMRDLVGTAHRDAQAVLEGRGGEQPRIAGATHRARGVAGSGPSIDVAHSHGPTVAKCVRKGQLFNRARACRETETTLLSTPVNDSDDHDGGASSKTSFSSADPPRNFSLSVGDRIRALTIGAPAYATRKKHIEDLEAAHVRTLVALHDLLVGRGRAPRP